ncbi:MAG: hypothetical protein GY866_27030 [Proteobacteria bacterium]|nr:hypothetical protein [Pseudomonadota bacterium]
MRNVGLANAVKVFLKRIFGQEAITGAPPVDANVRGIENGDEVTVHSPRVKVNFWALVTDDIVPGAIEANMGGGGPLGPKEWRNANVNTLTDFENRDRISGFPVYKALLCNISRLETPAEDK